MVYFLAKRCKFCRGSGASTSKNELVEFLRTKENNRQSEKNLKKLQQNNLELIQSLQKQLKIA
ncbi:hypothetical protein B0O44_109128 [Pedobacter nutrimenti]|jgi:hypothetical protein|uniref:Uncharacterized protein n=1 Tax=Pedobacter nutrimenti TaxID=1241337 RepID=A0A318UEY4_9SPHI|nr:hypothetical protein B0O44_109128 [Pedobacter nutrimenti]